MFDQVQCKRISPDSKTETCKNCGRKVFMSWSTGRQRMYWEHVLTSAAK